MSDEDRAEFERQTTWAGRTLAMKRPWIAVVAGALFAAGFLIAAPFAEPSSAGVVLAAVGLVTGGFIAGLAVWSLVNREEARRTIELRNRYMQRYLRKPKKWLLLLPPAAGLLAGFRTAGNDSPWYACVGVGLAAALIVGAGFGIQIWRARSGRMHRTEQQSDAQVQTG